METTIFEYGNLTEEEIEEIEELEQEPEDIEDIEDIEDDAWWR